MFFFFFGLSWIIYFNAFNVVIAVAGVVAGYLLSPGLDERVSTVVVGGGVVVVVVEFAVTQLLLMMCVGGGDDAEVAVLRW